MIFRSQANCSNIQAAVLPLKLALSLCFVNLWYIYIYKKNFQPVSAVVFFALHLWDFPTWRLINAEQSPPQDDALSNLSNHIFAKAATCIQACECSRQPTERPTVRRTETQSCAPSDPLCYVLWMSYVSLFPSVTNAAGHGKIRLAS